MLDRGIFKKKYDDGVESRNNVLQVERSNDVFGSEK